MNPLVKEKLGLFGGTFNPVHLGHLKAAEIVLGKLQLDKVLFIPSYIPPHKKSEDIASPENRLEMVKLALEGYPQFFPSSIEIEAKGTSYSILTLNKISESYPETDIFFILGIDAFLEIDTWRDYRKVIDRCHFVVISRPGYRLQDAKMVLEEKLPQKIILLPIRALDVASSEIRKKVREGTSIKGLVTGPVEKYIREHKLYQRENG